MQEEISPLQREVIILEKKFHYLLEMGITFSSDKELSSLLDSILSKAKNIIDFEAGSIFLVDTVSKDGKNKKILRFKEAQNDRVSKFQLFRSAAEYALPFNKESVAGYVAVTGKPLIIEDVNKIDKDEPYKFDDSFDKKIGYTTQSMLAIPILGSKGDAIGVLELINRRDKRALRGSEKIMPFLQQDVETINWVAGLAGVAVENIHMLNELKNHNVKLDQMVKERTHELNVALGKLEKDLNSARKMQLNIVPQKEKIESLSRISSLNISSIFKPCNKLGGDFWDIIKLSDEKIGIIVVDFAGHGITPSLNTFRIKEFIYSLGNGIESPAVLIEKMNKNIYNNYSMHATSIYAVYNKQNKKLTYCRAGHPYGIWLNKRGEKIIDLDSKGMALGFSPDSEYEEKDIILGKGDKVVFFTDGIVEMKKNDHEFFGEDRLKNILLQHKNKSASEISGIIMNAISEFTGNDDFDDDATLVVLEPV